MGTRQVQRRIRIERIIVGSLIADFKARWPDVRCCVEPEMFHDDYCRSVFETILELEAQGAEVDIVTVWLFRGGGHDEGIALFDLSELNDFNSLKWNYDIECKVYHRKKRDITFADYVTQLIKNHAKYQDQQDLQACLRH